MKLLALNGSSHKKKKKSQNRKNETCQKKCMCYLTSIKDPLQQTKKIKMSPSVYTFPTKVHVLLFTL